MVTLTELMPKIPFRRGADMKTRHGGRQGADAPRGGGPRQVPAAVHPPVRPYNQGVEGRLPGDRTRHHAVEATRPDSRPRTGQLPGLGTGLVRLPYTARGRTCGTLVRPVSAALEHTGAELVIAASAQEHGLTVATPNVRYFEPTGVRVFNPLGGYGMAWT